MSRNHLLTLGLAAALAAVPGCGSADKDQKTALARRAEYGRAMSAILENGQWLNEIDTALAHCQKDLRRMASGSAEERKVLECVAILTRDRNEAEAARTGALEKLDPVSRDAALRAADARRSSEELPVGRPGFDDGGLERAQADAALGALVKPEVPADSGFAGALAVAGAGALVGGGAFIAFRRRKTPEERAAEKAKKEASERAKRLESEKNLKAASALVAQKTEELADAQRKIKDLELQDLDVKLMRAAKEEAERKCVALTAERDAAVKAQQALQTVNDQPAKDGKPRDADPVWNPSETSPAPVAPPVVEPDILGTGQVEILSDEQDLQPHPADAIPPQEIVTGKSPAPEQGENQPTDEALGNDEPLGDLEPIVITDDTASVPAPGTADLVGTDTRRRIEDSLAIQEGPQDPLGVGAALSDIFGEEPSEPAAPRAPVPAPAHTHGELDDGSRAKAAGILMGAIGNVKPGECLEIFLGGKILCAWRTDQGALLAGEIDNDGTKATKVSARAAVGNSWAFQGDFGARGLDEKWAVKRIEAYYKQKYESPLKGKDFVGYVEGLLKLNA